MSNIVGDGASPLGCVVASCSSLSARPRRLPRGAPRRGALRRPLSADIAAAATATPDAAAAATKTTATAAAVTKTTSAAVATISAIAAVSAIAIAIVIAPIVSIDTKTRERHRRRLQLCHGDLTSRTPS